MALVEVVARRDIKAEPDDVLDAIADYKEVHPKLLPEQFTDYEVREGGDGEGTVLYLKLQATSRRVRECLLDVTEPRDDTLVETDRNSTLVTTWTVVPVAEGGTGQARVTIQTTWEGAGGVGGFFERLFAPRALKAIYDQVLANLATETEK
ncbi:SRPBCC family protein [Streptomyces radicis]|uniref:SRPBCC family protein n=1 Tax=Streptomyces radicis TaxID=1750517 RepID=A0A3A9VSU9_9ACTN|nr:SRPBCC family protein [Streptomyces radicis]RKN03859.1 SRPBCC family protein [Streptomyces radicis]RKN13902.1 SRPBCC family protein [Streptomyces radicis]